MTSLASVVETVAHQVSPTHKTAAHQPESSIPGTSSQFIQSNAFTPNTPSTRTSPPRLLSFTPMPKLRTRSRTLSADENKIMSHHYDREGKVNGGPSTSQFRGALEDVRPGLREKSSSERIGTMRNSKFSEDGWNPLRWLIDTPKVGNSPSTQSEVVGVAAKQSQNSSSGAPNLRRFSSAPHFKADKRTAASKWSRLRSLLPKIVAQSGMTSSQQGANPLTIDSVNLTDEFITGALCAVMLRLWFERDEKGHRRVPIFLHHLQIKISDSLHPLDGSKAVFRIECEYANGAARWVIYRQLREFLSLHRHYTFSNVYNRNINALPDFPRTSKLFCRLHNSIALILTFLLGLPYLKFLRKDKDNKVGLADFARMQRKVLENYLTDLIRAVVCPFELFRYDQYLCCFLSDVPSIIEPTRWFPGD
jgi:phospholipase D1/2